MCLVKEICGNSMSQIFGDGPSLFQITWLSPGLVWAIFEVTEVKVWSGLRKPESTASKANPPFCRAL